MFEENVECSMCGRKYIVSWPDDENFKCVCGIEGYWDHFFDEEDQPLHFFWRDDEYGNNKNKEE